VVQNALLQNALLGLGEADLEGKENVKYTLLRKEKENVIIYFQKELFLNHCTIFQFYLFSA
jgi:hypothetical protein